MSPNPAPLLPPEWWSHPPGEPNVALARARAHAPRSRHLIETTARPSSRIRGTGACRAAAFPFAPMFLNCSMQPHRAGLVNHQFRRGPGGLRSVGAVSAHRRPKSRAPVDNGRGAELTGID
jgi:hypothetical protein